jgi:hypothetical protein
MASFQPLSAGEAAQESARLQAFLPSLDSAWPAYEPVEGRHGEIDGIGSSGMMDTWRLCHFTHTSIRDRPSNVTKPSKAPVARRQARRGG